MGMLETARVICLEHSFALFPKSLLGCSVTFLIDHHFYVFGTRSTLRSGKGITLAGRDLRLQVHELMDNETLSQPNADDDMRHVLARPTE